jgi:hypothetical protein
MSYANVKLYNAVLPSYDDIKSKKNSKKGGKKPGSFKGFMNAMKSMQNE